MAYMIRYIKVLLLWYHSFSCDASQKQNYPMVRSALPWYAFLDSFLGELHLQLQSLSLQQRLN